MSTAGPPDSPHQSTWHESGLTQVFDRLSAREPELWLLAVGALLLDLGLTVYGLGLGLEEQNVLALKLLDQFGLFGLGLIKTGALGVGLVARVVLPARFVFTVPLGLAVPWFFAAAINISVILTTI